METYRVKVALDALRNTKIKQIQRLLNLIGDLRLLGGSAIDQSKDLQNLIEKLSQKIKETDKIIKKIEEAI